MNAKSAVLEQATYSYRASDKTGKVVRGSVRATSKDAAVQKVRAKDLIPMAVAKSTPLNEVEVKIPGLTDRVKMKPLAIATRQFAVLVRSVTLLQALEIVAEETTNKRLKEAFENVRAEVETGSSLSDAMERQDKVFPRLMLAIVRVGEAGGFLDVALDSAANNISSELRLRQKVVAAMAYPVVVMIVALLAVIVMLLFVVPVFANMFDNFGAELPLPTQILVMLSNSAVYWLPAMAVGGIGAAVWWQRNKEQERVRAVMHTLLLKMWVVGPLLKKVAIARFSRNLSTMFKSGVQMLQAVSTVGKVSNNWVIENALRAAETPLRFGHTLASQLERFPVFPQMVTQMIAVGESAGSLDAMLDQISEFYDAEVEDTTSKLTSIIEPLLIVFIAVLIGSMVIALYLPIFMMSSVMMGGA